MNIEPSHLSTTVASSGLVTDAQLLETFKAQALLAAEKHGISYCSNRTPVWRSSGKSVFSSDSSGYTVEFLSCPPLRSGVHKWSIKVEEVCSYTSLCVASSEHQVDCNKWLGHQSGLGWIYGNDGSAGTNEWGKTRKKANHPKFGKGSIVSFTLDLNEPGILSASVDGKPPSNYLRICFLNSKAVKP